MFRDLNALCSPPINNGTDAVCDASSIAVARLGADFRWMSLMSTVSGLLLCGLSVGM